MKMTELLLLKVNPFTFVFSECASDLKDFGCIKRLLKSSGFTFFECNFIYQDLEWHLNIINL